MDAYWEAYLDARRNLFDGDHTAIVITPVSQPFTHASSRSVHFTAKASPNRVPVATNHTHKAYHRVRIRSGIRSLVRLNRDLDQSLGSLVMQGFACHRFYP